MHKIFSFLLLSLFVVSCSESNGVVGVDDGEDTESSEDFVKLGLYAEQKAGNIFELMSFDLLTERSVSLYEIRETYDSLIWSVPDIGRHHLMTNNNFTFKWSHNFFQPGEYQTVLLGYKNDEVIVSDTVTVDIKDKRDFLGYNWKDITASSEHSTGYYDVFKQKSFSTYYTYENELPAVYLFMRYDESEEESIFAEKSQYVLFDFISSLYSKPKYDGEDKNLLLVKYNDLFKVKKNGDDPLCIWITPSARIVLLKYKDEWANYDQYRVYAEPNN